MSYKPEVAIKENGVEKWYPNALVFATEAEALAAASDTYGRWMMARGFRAVSSEDKVNYRWNAGEGLVAVNQEVMG